MTRFLIASLLTLPAVFSASGDTTPDPILNEPVLPGSLSSCDECTLEEVGSLPWPSKCSKSCGTMVASDVAPGSNIDAFSNDDGNLLYGEVRTLENRLPSGSYLESCDGCNVIIREDKTRILACSACKNEWGSNTTTEMALGTCERIGNKNGILLCQDYAPDRVVAMEKGLPDGSYLDSCSGCSYEREEEVGDVLTCMACESDPVTRQRKSSKIILKQPCPTVLINHNGYLECQLEKATKESVTAGIQIKIKRKGLDRLTIYDEKPIASDFEIGFDGVARQKRSQ